MVSDITDKLLPKIEDWHREAYRVEPVIISILNSLINRGIKDILILCFDGLTGIKEAVTAAFSEMEQHRCIVHMVRNTLKYAANKDMKEFAKDLKVIYTAPDEETACNQLENVTEKWGKKYPNVMERWKSNWDAGITKR